MYVHVCTVRVHIKDISRELTFPAVPCVRLGGSSPFLTYLCMCNVLLRSHTEYGNMKHIIGCIHYITSSHAQCVNGTGPWYFELPGHVHIHPTHTFHTQQQLKPTKYMHTHTHTHTHHSNPTKNTTYRGCSLYMYRPHFSGNNHIHVQCMYMYNYIARLFSAFEFSFATLKR